MATISAFSSLDTLLRARLQASLDGLEPPAVAEFSATADPDDIQAVRAALNSATGAAVPL